MVSVWQYTGSSFGQTLVALFAFILWPRTHRPAVRGAFPGIARRKSAVPDPVLNRPVEPLLGAAGRDLRALHVQPGQTQPYVLSVLAIVPALLVRGALGAWT